jgi:hypothetical protein
MSNRFTPVRRTWLESSAELTDFSARYAVFSIGDQRSVGRDLKRFSRRDVSIFDLTAAKETP